MAKARILFVSYHFFPSREIGAKRPSETALFLRDAGFDVSVVCARADADQFYAPGASPEGIHLVEVLAPKQWTTVLWLGIKKVVRFFKRREVRHGDAVGAQAVSQADSGPRRFEWLRRQVNAFEGLLAGDGRWLSRCIVKIWLLCRKRQYDLVIASGPPFVSYLCGGVAARIARARFVLDLRDPWDLYNDRDWRDRFDGHPMSRLQNYMRKRCMSSADAFVVAAPGIVRHTRALLGDENKPIELVRNGFDPDDVIEAPAPVGRLAMLYAGYLYPYRNPFPFLESLKTLLADEGVMRDRVSFTLIGGCEMVGTQYLRPWLVEHGLDDVVSVREPVPRQQLREIIASCNVLVNFSQDQPDQIPGKSYEYLASRRQIFTIAEASSDVAELLREAGVGALLKPGDTASMVSELRRAYDQFVVRQEPYEPNWDRVTRFSRAGELEKFLQIVMRFGASD
jgi:glycosyltransferase involved in cell wall biosynthesis